MDLERGNLKAPPKTIAANSIVVKIGDFKAQSKLDREQLKEMEKKKKQKRQLAKSKSRADDHERNADHQEIAAFPPKPPRKGSVLGDSGFHGPSESQASMPPQGSESGVPVAGINLSSHLAKKEHGNLSDKKPIQTQKMGITSKKRNLP